MAPLLQENVLRNYPIEWPWTTVEIGIVIIIFYSPTIMNL